MQEHCYGIIPLKSHPTGWKVLLVQHRAGHWSFPKGHPHPDEAPRETAVRELKEETGLAIMRFLSETPVAESYFFVCNQQRIHKTVTYFLAEVKEGNVVLQHEEVSHYRWLPLDQAASCMTFKEGKALCQKIRELSLGN